MAARAGLLALWVGALPAASSAATPRVAVCLIGSLPQGDTFALRRSINATVLSVADGAWSADTFIESWLPARPAGTNEPDPLWHDLFPGIISLGVELPGPRTPPQCERLRRVHACADAKRAWEDSHHFTYDAVVELELDGGCGEAQWGGIGQAVRAAVLSGGLRDRPLERWLRPGGTACCALGHSAGFDAYARAWELSVSKPCRGKKLPRRSSGDGARADALVATAAKPAPSAAALGAALLERLDAHLRTALPGAHTHEIETAAAARPPAAPPPTEAVASAGSSALPRVAVCVAGLFRGHRKAMLPSLRAKVLHNNSWQADLFVETWLHEGADRITRMRHRREGHGRIVNERWRFLYPEAVSVRQLRTPQNVSRHFRGLSLPAGLAIAHANRFMSTLPNLGRISDCARAIRRWQAATGLAYDVVVKLRPDKPCGGTSWRSLRDAVQAVLDSQRAVRAAAAVAGGAGGSGDGGSRGAASPQAARRQTRAWPAPRAAPVVHGRQLMPKAVLVAPGSVGVNRSVGIQFVHGNRWPHMQVSDEWAVGTPAAMQFYMGAFDAIGRLWRSAEMQRQLRNVRPQAYNWALDEGFMLVHMAQSPGYYPHGSRYTMCCEYPQARKHYGACGTYYRALVAGNQTSVLAWP